jgi:hypothetical protein
MFEAFVLKVLIATPGDTGDEVAAVKESLHSGNGLRAESAQTSLLPRHWRSDAVPRLGTGSGQGVINKQLESDADIVIGVFDSRLGHPTADAVSGTAEEIQRAIDAGKDVHVWFSNEPVDRRAAADLEQLAALQKFRVELQTQGLLAEYDDLNDLGRKVSAAIESDVTQMALGAPTVRRLATEEIRRLEAEEIEPWDVDRIPGYNIACNLVNKTGTPKYDVAISGPFTSQPNTFDFIGPRGHKQFGVITGLNAEVWIEVSWHLREDRTDSPSPQRIVIP